MPECRLRGVERAFARRFGRILLLSFFVSCFGYAQETSGTIRGTVTDPSGAAVGTATVELTGSLLPRPFVLHTNAAGDFQVSQVPPGTGYLLSVAAQGFRTAKLGGINVEIGKATSV